MRSLVAKVFLTMAASSASIVAHHSPLPPTAHVATVKTVSNAAISVVAQAWPHRMGGAAISPLDSTSARKTTDTAQIERELLPAIGQPAPQLHVDHWLNTPTPSWAPLKFGDGHVYVLDFTATWCLACPNMYPVMSEVVKQYAARGVRVLYVTALWGMDYRATMPPMLQAKKHDKELAELSTYFAQHQVTEPVVVYDTTKVQIKDYADLVQKKRELTLPKVVIVDGRGIVQKVMTGLSAEQVRQQTFATLATLVPLSKP